MACNRVERGAKPLLYERPSVPGRGVMSIADRSIVEGRQLHCAQSLAATCCRRRGLRWSGADAATGPVSETCEACSTMPRASATTPIDAMRAVWRGPGSPNAVKVTATTIAIMQKHKNLPMEFIPLAAVP